MEEIWKDTEKLGMKYSVSNYGKIIGLGRGKELLQRYNDDGYKEVTMGNEKTGRTSRLVHRLVAEAFISNPNNYPEVNHKDTIRDNNKVDNLEWCTHEENIRYSADLGNYKGRFGELNPNYGNDTLKKKYLENPELGKENSRRPREQNGRCVKIKMTDIKTGNVKQFNFIGECCEYLKDEFNIKTKINSLRHTINLRTKSNKLYKNRFKFEREV